MFNCCVFPFLCLVLPLDDDVNEVEERRSFFRLSFSQRSSFDEIIPKEEIFPSYYNERCMRVCSRRTQSDRDLLLLFRGRFKPRDRKEVWIYMCVCKSTKNMRYYVGLLNGMIKIKGTEESRSLPYRFAKNGFRVTFFEHFFF